MKKLILMTTILFSITSSFAEGPAQEEGVVAANGVGQADTRCPAGDDSQRGAPADQTPQTTVTPAGGSATIDGQ